MRGIFPGLAAGALFASPVPLLAGVESASPIVRDGETILLVEAEGVAKAKPEEMTIHVGVVSTGPTAAAALEANNRKMQRVIEAIRAEGIGDSDLKTSELTVEPQFADDRRDARDVDIIGFEASNKITLTTRRLDRAGLFISSLFEAGANDIDGPMFQLEEDTERRVSREAELAALREARSQAETTAEALGMRVWRVLRISDREIDFTDRSGYIVVTGSRMTPTPIEPGELTVTATYYVEFALVPSS